MKKKNSVWEWILIALLTLMMTFGLMISFAPNSVTILELCKSHANSVLMLLMAAGVTSFVALKLLFERMDKAQVEYGLKTNSDPEMSIISIKRWIQYFAIIFICWLPYLLICYPTITRGYDYFWQLLRKR